jgi:rhodanese-related sulfurtransferase
MGQEDKKMATLNKSPKKNLRAVFFMACMTLIVFNSYALAHIDVTAEQARDLIDSTNDLIVVDVREPYEYCDAVGHIPGALNYPLSSGVLEARYEELPIDGPVLVVCRSGGRSNQAANFLDSKGFSFVYDMMGGMSAWIWETEPCKDDGSSGTTEPAETNTYVFLPGQSTVAQTGGIAGVHWTYSVEGLFQLTVEPNAGTASFAHVDANATDDSQLQRTLDPKEVFNMTTLVGAVLDDTTISFTGKADDGSDVLITVRNEDDLAYLVGETIPPPNSADFFLFSLDAVAQRKYSGGTGDPNEPYRIATAEDLMLLGDSPEDYDKHFIMTADIDLDPNLPGRKVFDRAVIAFVIDDITDNAFHGSFNGNGHTISNLVIEGEGYYIGLFGMLAPGAEIKDLGVVDVNITSSDPLVGGLVGNNWDGIIANSYSSGVVTGDSHSVGGLVGANETGGTITNCFNTCTVKGNWRVGGLVGRNHGRIITSYSSGAVNGGSAVGGLVGRNGSSAFFIDSSGTILNCYSTGMVSGNIDTGGLVGVNNAGDVSGSFWDTQTSIYNTSEGGIGLTTVEMQISSTFLEAGWDFVDETMNGTEDIWWILEGQGYPRLWWELVPEN